MVIRGTALRLAAALLMIFFPFAGCAPQKQALRDDGSVVAVRLPPMEAMDVRLRSERPEAPPELPFSVADETRGRWLTLVEVTVTPVSAGNLPETESAGNED